MVDYEIIHDCIPIPYFCFNCGGCHSDCPYKNIFRLKYNNEEYNELMDYYKDQMGIHEKIRRDLDVDLLIAVSYRDLFEMLFLIYVGYSDVSRYVLHKLVDKKLNIISIQNFINMGKYLEDHSDNDLIDNIEDAINYEKLIMIKPVKN